jgi:hypothetical protein
MCPPLTISLCVSSTVKLGHWDRDIRLLAAKALGKLAQLDQDLAVDNLRKVIVHCMSPLANLRHGSLLAVGEIVLSLCLETNSPFLFPLDLADDIAQLVPRLDKARMYR